MTEQTERIPCPACAELILPAAQVCRYCGRPVSRNAQGVLLDQPGHYNMPLRFEQQTSQSDGSPSGPLFTSSSSGIAFKGSVCPTCKSADYTNTYSVWHGVLAICFFPIGLLGLAFPIKECVTCKAPFGAGVELIKVMRVLAIMSLMFIGLVVLAIIGAAASH